MRQPETPFIGDRVTRRCWQESAALLAIIAVAAFGCSEKSPVPAKGGGERRPFAATTCDTPTVVECAPDGTSLGALPAQAVKANGSPIRVGMINQETGPAGAFPELSLADRAAVRFINDELGGVDGRPIEFSVCDTKFSPEASTACAQQFVQQGVVAVAGGIDVFGNGIAILEQNNIPYVGGIPLSFASAQSPVSFQFSGGSWGAVAAFVHYAVETKGAKKISIMYGEFGSITDAAKLGEQLGQKLGAEVKLVPFPIVTQDLLTPLTAANDGNPDAIVALTADTGCVPVFKSAHDLGVRALLFFTGACASPNILSAAGEASVDGRYFNVEGLIPEEPDPDSTLYTFIIDKYGDGLDAASAATVSFRAMMDLYLQMKAIGGDKISAQRLIEGFRAARDAPNFMGHPYTCDGKQVPRLPSLCAPQQVIALRRDGRLVSATGWIDVPEILK